MSVERIITKDLNKFLGLSLPLVNSKFGYFEPCLLTVDQVKTNIKNILLTVKKERIGRPDFGSNLYNILFENIDIDETETLITETVRTEILKYYPKLKLGKIFAEITNENVDTYSVNISIPFSIDNEIYEELTFNILHS